MSINENWPIGVFASFDAGVGVSLEVVAELGLSTIHLHSPTNRSCFKEIADKCTRLGIDVSVVFAGFEGESYQDIPTVKKTVGLVPLETRDVRVPELKEIIDFTRRINCGATGLHLGFIPTDSASIDFQSLVSVIQDVCDYSAAQGVSIHLETGQEPVDVLLTFLRSVNRNNLFVNFDPANMILYGCGDPIAALKKLGPYVRSVHCKDATWSSEPGVSWGVEKQFGDGEVGVESFLRTLKAIGYEGPLTIERELENQAERQKIEIKNTIDLIHSITL